MVYISFRSRGEEWTIQRSLESIRNFDYLYHSCIYERNFTLLPRLRDDNFDRIKVGEIFSLESVVTVRDVHGPARAHD